MTPSLRGDGRASARLLLVVFALGFVAQVHAASSQLLAVPAIGTDGTNHTALRVRLRVLVSPAEATSSPFLPSFGNQLAAAMQTDASRLRAHAISVPHNQSAFAFVYIDLLPLVNETREPTVMRLFRKLEAGFNGTGVPPSVAGAPDWSKGGALTAKIDLNFFPTFVLVLVVLCADGALREPGACPPPSAAPPLKTADIVALVLGVAVFVALLALLVRYCSCIARTCCAPAQGRFISLQMSDLDGAAPARTKQRTVFGAVGSRIVVDTADDSHFEIGGVGDDEAGNGHAVDDPDESGLHAHSTLDRDAAAIQQADADFEREMMSGEIHFSPGAAAATAAPPRWQPPPEGPIDPKAGFTLSEKDGI